MQFASSWDMEISPKRQKKNVSNKKHILFINSTQVNLDFINTPDFILHLQYEMRWAC